MTNINIKCNIEIQSDISDFHEMLHFQNIQGEAMKRQPLSPELMAKITEAVNALGDTHVKVWVGIDIFWIYMKGIGVGRGELVQWMNQGGDHPDVSDNGMQMLKALISELIDKVK